MPVKNQMGVNAWQRAIWFKACCGVALQKVSTTICLPSVMTGQVVGPQSMHSYTQLADSKRHAISDLYGSRQDADSQAAASKLGKRSKYEVRHGKALTCTQLNSNVP